MGWIEKEKQAKFEQQPIPGLFFLDGDILARAFKQPWTKGQKYPTIVYPSGIQCDLWESSDPASGGIVHLFGEMDLSLYGTRDEAFAHASDIAEQVGYVVTSIGENQLDLWGDEGRLRVTFDNQERRITNVE